MEATLTVEYPECRLCSNYEKPGLFPFVSKCKTCRWDKNGYTKTNFEK